MCKSLIFNGGHLTGLHLVKTCVSEVRGSFPLLSLCLVLSKALIPSAASLQLLSGSGVHLCSKVVNVQNATPYYVNHQKTISEEINQTVSAILHDKEQNHRKYKVRDREKVRCGEN